MQRGEKISTYAPKSWSGSEKRNFKVHDPFVLHLKIQAGFRDCSLVNGIDQSETNSLKPKKVFCCDSFVTIVRLWFEEEFRMRLTNAYACSTIRPTQKKMRSTANAKLIQRYYYYLACRTQIARSKSIIPLEKLFEIIAMGIQESIFNAKNIHFYAKIASFHRIRLVPPARHRTGPT